MTPPLNQSASAKACFAVDHIHVHSVGCFSSHNVFFSVVYAQCCKQCGAIAASACWLVFLEHYCISPET